MGYVSMVIRKGRPSGDPIEDGRLVRLYKRRRSKMIRRLARLHPRGDTAVSLILDHYVNRGEEGSLRMRDFQWLAFGRTPTVVHCYVVETFEGLDRFPVAA